jgi:hypothetical protein
MVLVTSLEVELDPARSPYLMQIKFAQSRKLSCKMTKHEAHFGRAPL